jgi:hypothetical protein
MNTQLSTYKLYLGKFSKRNGNMLRENVTQVNKLHDKGPSLKSGKLLRWSRDTVLLWNLNGYHVAVC